MPFITISSGLTIKVPTRGTKNWDETFRTDTMIPISEHDHTGSGKGLQLGTGSISADAITGAKIRLDNDEYLRGRNAADTGNINIIKVNTNDVLLLGASLVVPTIGDATDATKALTLTLSGATTAKTMTLISAHTDNRSLTLPDATDTLVGRATTDTLTNKTLTGNTAVNLISGSGTLILNTTGTITVPNATDTLVGKATTDTLTNKTIDQDGTGNSITNIANASIKAAAAIDVNKLAALTASEMVISDVSGFLTSAAVATYPSLAELIHVKGVTSAIQTQIDTKITASSSDTLTNKSIDSDNNTITNIVNADIKAAAAIAVNKLAALTASEMVISDGSGFLSSAAVATYPSLTELTYVKGVTSAIQTQINTKLPTTVTTTGDIIYSSSGSTAARLGAGSNGEVLTLAAGVPSWAAVSVSPTAPTSKSTTYTALTTDDLIKVDTSGGAWTLTLYTASGNGGRRLKIIKTTSDTNALTIDANASETINGNLTTSVNLQYESLVLYCDGTNWLVEDRKCNTAWTDYTPSSNGIGTPTFSFAKWRRVGDSVEINVRFLTGTVTAAEAQIGLPNSVSIATGYTLESVGSTQNATDSNVNHYSALGTSSDSFINFGNRSTGANNYRVAQNGNSIFGSTSEFQVIATVPISGWKSENE